MKKYLLIGLLALLFVLVLVVAMITHQPAESVMAAMIGGGFLLFWLAMLILSSD